MSDNVSNNADRLRKYVVVLCTHGQVGLLCQLPFAGLQQEVIQVLTQKARAEDVQLMIDGQSPNYYEILYAYHVFRSDYRSGMLSSSHSYFCVALLTRCVVIAALFMHEYALRLGTELHVHDHRQHLQRLVPYIGHDDSLKEYSSTFHLQANAYLTCLNAFRLIDPEYAWIHKNETPFSALNADERQVLPNMHIPVITMR